MNLSRTGRLYMGCFMFSLFSFGAFVGEKPSILLFNYAAVIASLLTIFWFCRVTTDIEEKASFYNRSIRLLFTTFIFVSCLVCGQFFNEQYKWMVVAAAALASLGYINWKR